MFNLFSWFNEEKIIKKIRDLNKEAEAISNVLQAQIEEQKINLAALSKTREEVISTRATLAALLELVTQTEASLGVIEARQMEGVEVLADTKDRSEAHFDKLANVVTVAGNAAVVVTSSPEAMAELFERAGVPVLMAAIDRLANDDQWQLIEEIRRIAAEKMAEKGEG